MSTPRFLAGLLAVWLLGAAFYSLHGRVHFLLIVALIVFLVDRFGRGEVSD